MEENTSYVIPDLELGMVMDYKDIVATVSGSDEKLKKNIEECDMNALEKINKIRHITYDWDKVKSGKEGHINIGYGARELKEIDNNFVIKNMYKNGDELEEIYTINVLNVLSTATKAIQELSNQNEKLQEQINELEILAGVHTHTHTHTM